MKFIIILLFVLYTSITPAADNPKEGILEISLFQKGDAISFNEPSVFIGKEVELGNGIQIIGAVYISGKSRIGNGCTIYPFSVVQDCILEDGVTVLPNCFLEKSTFKSKSQVGPFAHVSEGSVIGQGAIIGNFVEIKRSEMGDGTKAKHLTYLGDTTTGEKVNIGAGTITCNYNGVEKQSTQIGDNAFIGSNSTLIAPINIGNGAFIAAGSTITENVPDDGFAIARSKQTTKHGYASKLLAKFRALKDQKK